jgi:hypothetical protein
MCSSVNPIKPDPAWSPEEHLERTYRRGRQLRRRRQVGTTTAALVAVVGLAVGLSGSTSPVLHPLQVLTGTSSNSDDNKPAATTSTTASDDLSLSHSSSTTIRSGSNAAAPARKSASSSTTVAAGTTDATSTAKTPPTSPLQACKATQLAWSTSTNKSAYRAGDTVEISLTARNTGDIPCYAPGACDVQTSATVQDNTGAVVWSNGPHTVGCSKPEGTKPLLNPNDSHSYGNVGAWDENVNGQRAGVGSYSATAHHGSSAATSATFALR